MPTPAAYRTEQPERTAIDASKGAAVIEFGTNWCGICNAAQPVIVEAFASHPQVEHMKVEDGSGRPLGRSFNIKLWPTLIFLQDGREVARLVRPTEAPPIADALAGIDPIG